MDDDWPLEQGPVAELIHESYATFADFLDEHPDVSDGQLIVALNFIHLGGLERLVERRGLDPRAVDIFTRGAADDFVRMVRSSPLHRPDIRQWGKTADGR